jgi:hypothetical protein
VNIGAETGTNTGSHTRCDKWCTESSPVTDKSKCEDWSPTTHFDIAVWTPGKLHY